MAARKRKAATKPEAPSTQSSDAEWARSVISNLHLSVCRGLAAKVAPLTLEEEHMLASWAGIPGPIANEAERLAVAMKILRLMDTGGEGSDRCAALGALHDAYCRRMARLPEPHGYGRTPSPKGWIRAAGLMPPVVDADFEAPEVVRQLSSKQPEELTLEDEWVLARWLEMRGPIANEEEHLNMACELVELCDYGESEDWDRYKAVMALMGAYEKRRGPLPVGRGDNQAAG